MPTTTTTRRNPGNLTSDRLDRLIGVQELADLLGLQRSTIYDWTHRQTIPFYRLGRKNLFDPDEIAVWLESKHVMPGGPK